jgi:folate-binding protein YgfZ
VSGSVPSDEVRLSGPEDEDYAALRHGVGAVTIDRDVVRVSGPDALSYLQGQCSQDLTVVGVGGSCDALLLTPQGKLDALIRITRAAEDDFLLDVDGGYGAAVMARLARFKLRVKADIEAVEWRVVALRGPEAGSAVDHSAPMPGPAFVVPYSWGGVTGVDLIGAEVQIPAHVRPCGARAWQSLRVEAGIPVMGAELDERTIAAEAGLLERCVSFTKGCYTGQELVARLDARGNKVARRLRGLVVDPVPDTAAGVRPGAEVSVAGRVVGRLTSVAWSPRLESEIALGYLHRDVDPPCAVQVGTGESGEQTVEARAVALPMVV